MPSGKVTIAWYSELEIQISFTNLWILTASIKKKVPIIGSHILAVMARLWISEIYSSPRG